MWNLTKLVIKNLMTHHHTEFEFKSGLIVVAGKNQDDIQESDSNGSGKSGLIEAVNLALFNEVYRKVNKELFITRGKKECYVSLEMYNDTTKSKFRIERTLYRGTKSAIVKLYDNDVLLEYVKDPNRKIIEVVGIDKEDLQNYFIIGQGNLNNFFTAGDAKQKEIISRFSKMVLVDKVIEEINQELAQKDSEYYKLNEQLNKIDSKKELQEEQIIDLKNEIREDNEKDVRNEQIKKLKERVIACDTKIQELSEQLKDAQKKLDRHSNNFKQEDYDKLCKTLDDNQNKIEEIQEVTHKLNKEKKKLEVSLSGVVECPKCNEKFLPDSGGLTSTDIQNKISKIQKDISKHNIKINTIQEESGEIELNIAKFEELRDEIKHLKKFIARISNSLLEEQEDKQRQSNRLKSIAQEKKDDNDLNYKLRLIEELETALNSKKEQISSLKTDINTIERDKSELNMLKFHMDKTGFKTYLANLTVKTIENTVNHHLSRFNVSLSVVINGVKINKDGTVRDKIDVFINDGQDESSYNAYSGGEKARVALAGIISLMEIINNSAEYGKGLNFLFIDENILYLDNKGQTRALHLLENIGVNCMVIMHQIDGIDIKNKVICIKKDKVTKVQYDYQKN